MYRPAMSFRKTTASELSRMARSVSSPRRETSWYRSASRVLASDSAGRGATSPSALLSKMPSTTNTISRKTIVRDAESRATQAAGNRSKNRRRHSMRWPSALVPGPPARRRRSPPEDTGSAEDLARPSSRSVALIEYVNPMADAATAVKEKKVAEIPLRRSARRIQSWRRCAADRRENRPRADRGRNHRAPIDGPPPHPGSFPEGNRCGRAPPSPSLTSDRISTPRPSDRSILGSRGRSRPETLCSKEY